VVPPGFKTGLAAIAVAGVFDSLPLRQVSTRTPQSSLNGFLCRQRLSTRRAAGSAIFPVNLSIFHESLLNNRRKPHFLDGASFAWSSGHCP
jgi:hypothetical protein